MTHNADFIGLVWVVKLWGSLSVQEISYATTAVSFTTPLIALGFDADSTRNEAKTNEVYLVWIRDGSTGNQLKFACGSNNIPTTSEVAVYLCFAI